MPASDGKLGYKVEALAQVGFLPRRLQVVPTATSGPPTNYSYYPLAQSSRHTSFIMISTFLGLAIVGANAVLAASSSYASRPPLSTIEPSLTQIVASEATQAALSPVSNVAGLGFDRIIQIWLENTVGSLHMLFVFTTKLCQRITVKLLLIPTCNSWPRRALLSPTTMP